MDRLRKTQCTGLMTLQNEQTPRLTDQVTDLPPTCANAPTLMLLSAHHGAAAGPADQDRATGSTLPHIRCGRRRQHDYRQDVT